MSREDSPPAESQGRVRARLFLVLRLLGLAVFLGFALRAMETLKGAFEVLAGAAPLDILFAVLFYAIGLGLSAVRVGLLLGAWRMPNRRTSLLGDVVSATGLNAVTISGAGEMYRVQALVARGASVLDGTLAVFVDRLVGLAVFVLAAGVGLISTGITQMESGFSPVLLWGAVAAAAALATFLLLPRARRALLDRLQARAIPISTLCGIGALALATLGFWILSVVFLAKALGIDVGLFALATSAPLVAVASFLPITIGGIGVRETGYALLLAGEGVSHSSAIALGMAQYGTFLVVAIAGGVIWAGRLLRNSPSDSASSVSSASGGSASRAVDS